MLKKASFSQRTGKDGSDARDYQEKEVFQAIQEVDKRRINDD